MKIFYSEIDWWLVLIPAAFFIYKFVVSLRDKNWKILGINVAAMAFLIYVFCTTYYYFEENSLRIKVAFFTDITVPVQSIESIEATTDFWGAPAASIYRLSIETERGNEYMISPKLNERREFIDSLLQLNPSIEVENQLMDPRTF